MRDPLFTVVNNLATFPFFPFSVLHRLASRTFDKGGVEGIFSLHIVHGSRVREFAEQIFPLFLSVSPNGADFGWLGCSE